jgi:molybdate transport system substrate-binding protein
MSRTLSFLFVALTAWQTACQHGDAARANRSEINVAAAANLAEAAQIAGSLFESQTGIHPVFSFGSTAQLTTQIENSAPFDVFLAADAQHVDQLDREGLLIPGTQAIYATGILTLWVPANSAARIENLGDLVSPGARIIAIAKPELAPYGQAAVEALQHAGIWNQVKSKIVYAENVNMAKQYGASKNADAVFTAYSLVLHEAGKVIQVSENLHQPITQKLGILKRSERQDPSRRFTEFMLRGRGRDALNSHGYRTSGLP